MIDVNDLKQLIEERSAHGHTNPDMADHLKRLERQKFDIRVALTDGTELFAHAIRLHEGGVGLPIGDIEDEHAREENGESIFYPWHRVMSIHAHWFVPDESESEENTLG